MARLREPWISLQLYRLLKWVVITPILRLYCRARIYGREKIPLKGPFIMVANHASDFDPPMLAVTMNRPIAYMAKEELFRVPGLGLGIRLYGAYPVKRGSPDRSAIRAALAQVELGWGVGIFLSGTRTPDGRIPEPKMGAALIAAKAQIPLLPVSIWGSQKIIKKGSPFPRPAPVTIRISDLIPPPVSTAREDLEAVTQKCVEIIHSMYELGR